MNGWYETYTKGSARWASEYDCKRAGLIGGKGVYIGQSPQAGKDMFLDGDAPLTLIGGAASGKTASVCFYSALYDGPLYVLDPKGEISAVISDYLRSKGFEVWLINPSGLLGMQGHKPDLLDILQPGDINLTSNCRMILEALVPITQSSGNDDTGFYQKCVRRRISHILKHLVLTYGKTSLLDLHRVLGWMRGNWNAFENFARDMKKSPDSEICNTAQEILDERKNTDRQWNAFITTLSECFSWLEDESIQACLGGSDFSLSVLSEKKAAVFLMVPPEFMNQWQPFLRLCLTLPVLFKQRKPQAPTVLYMLDELATLGKSEMIERLYSFGRGGGNRVFGVFQSLAQIEKFYRYPEILLSSSQAVLFKGCNDSTTARMISTMLGDQTVQTVNPRYQSEVRHKRQGAVNSLLFGGGDPMQVGMELSHWNRETQHRDKIERPLATISEVLSMPDNRMIGFVTKGDCPPILMHTTPYYKRRDLRRVFAPNPYHS